MMQLRKRTVLPMIAVVVMLSACGQKANESGGINTGADTANATAGTGAGNSETGATGGSATSPATSDASSSAWNQIWPRLVRRPVIARRTASWAVGELKVPIRPAISVRSPRGAHEALADDVQDERHCEQEQAYKEQAGIGQ